MISQKDLAIMACLRKDARMKLTKMSREIKMPISTIFDRIKFHEGGLIKSSTCLIDFSKLGFHARANAIFSISREHKDEFRKFMESNENVNSVFKINNGFDYLAELVFRNINDLDVFLEGIEKRFNVKKKEVYYIIDEIKRESFLSDKNTAALLGIQV